MLYYINNIIMSDGGNWRMATTKTFGFTEKKDPFGKSSSFFSHSKQDKRIKMKEPRSFNKKIILQHGNKNTKTYKQLNNLSNLEFTSVKIQPKKCNETTIKKYEQEDSWGDDKAVLTIYEKIEEKCKGLPNRELFSKEHGIRNKFPSIKTTQEEQIQITKQYEELQLQQYILLSNDELGDAYKYYKQLKNLSLSDFINKYSYRVLIEMDNKDLFKLKKKVTKFLQQIEKIKKIKKPNKQQLDKLQKETEFKFKQSWINFYINCIYSG